jgi:hypothetical protein
MREPLRAPSLQRRVEVGHRGFGREVRLAEIDEAGQLFAERIGWCHGEARWAKWWRAIGLDV